MRALSVEVPPKSAWERGRPARSSLGRLSAPPRWRQHIRRCGQERARRPRSQGLAAAQQLGEQAQQGASQSIEGCRARIRGSVLRSQCDVGAACLRRAQVPSRVRIRTPDTSPDGPDVFVPYYRRIGILDRWRDDQSLTLREPLGEFEYSHLPGARVLVHGGRD
jgi:hypothetical protein